ncbi:MAG TPA: GxxExxY protein [Armatimonadaceae bacterium]|nr:GxxExxY protein [Armatimonadaceae bacterium]
MTENDIAREVVDAAYRVHVTLGPGLLESVYEAVLAHELRRRGLGVEAQVPLSIRYGDLHIEDAFRADLIVEGKVIVELKSVENTTPVHHKQLLTYLRLTERRLGLLINFGTVYIKDGISRVANNLPDHSSSLPSS